MRALNFVYIFCLCLAANALAATESSISATMPQGEDSSSSVQLKPAINLLVGTSSNVGKLQSETPGAYGKVSPSLGLELTPWDSFVFTSQLNADFKQFAAEDARTIGDENSYELRNLAIWFPSDEWEVGGDIGALRSESRLPVQISSTQTTAQQQKYLEPDARLYAAWSRNQFSLESGAFGKTRNYSTLMIDRGNSFHNDFDQYGGDLKIGYSVSAAFKLTLRGLHEEKQYKEKPADFTDGAASNPAAPLPTLKESANELGLIAEYSLGKVKFVSTPGVRFNKDRIFGARDSQTWKFQQKIAVPITDRLSWNPTFTVSQESFSRFRSAPEIDPFGTPLRKDLDLRVASPFKYSLSHAIQILADYSFTRKDSNYANSSYSEHAVSTGLSVSM